jgi:hypothetical protein
MTADTSISLAPLATMTFTMQTTILRDCPVGTRVVVQFDDVRVEGERLRARQHGATSADWLVIGPEGTATLDVRILLQTDDGALVYLHATGRTDATEFARGGAMWLTPLFETGDARHAWLNKIQSIAKGHATGPQATFQIYEAR